MQASICSRCGRNPAVVFITKIEKDETRSEGLCLKCARELHIKPVDDILTKMGISDEDLESLSGDMMNALSGAEELLPTDDDGGEDDQEDDRDEVSMLVTPLLEVLELFGGVALRVGEVLHVGGHGAGPGRVVVAGRVRTGAPEGVPWNPRDYPTNAGAWQAAFPAWNARAVVV